MCLLYDKVSTEKFWKTKSRKNKSFFWAWKNVGIYENEVCSPAMDIEIKPGWFISDRVKQKPLEDMCDTSYSIYRGIHVYVDTGILGQWDFEEDSYRIKVKCYKKDFVASSTIFRNDSKWKIWGGEAVFMKIFIPKSEIDRILKKAKIK